MCPRPQTTVFASTGSGELPPITLLTRKRRPAVEWENAEQELPVAVAKKPRVTKATKRNPPATGGGVKGLEGVWQEMERERYVHTHTRNYYFFGENCPL